MRCRRSWEQRRRKEELKEIYKKMGVEKERKEELKEMHKKT